MSARYWTISLIALAICGASVVAVDWGIYHVTRIGSCASGGPYISARPCPPGTGGYILALIGGIFGGLIGIGIYAARGKGGRPPKIGLGLIMWSLLFITLPLAMAVSAFGPANNDSSGARLTTIILAVTFLPLGLAPLPFAARSRRKQALAINLMQTGKRCPGEVLFVHDTGVTINDNPRVKITVRAQPPDDSGFTIEKTATVSRVAIPRAGDRCTVFYDPGDRLERNAITFDHVPGTEGAVTRAGSNSPAAISGRPPPATPPATTPPAAGQDDDPLEKIKELGELRDRGLITQDEFDTQKRRLLDEV